MEKTKPLANVKSIMVMPFSFWWSLGVGCLFYGTTFASTITINNNNEPYVVLSLKYLYLSHNTCN